MTPFQVKYNEYIVHDDIYVKGFFGFYRFLSNFELCNVMFEGIAYSSSEAAYQAAKTKDNKTRLSFTTMSPREAKKAGSELVLRPNWDSIKYRIMQSIVTNKFDSNKQLFDQLMFTGNRLLFETNHWGDVYWGEDPKTGGANNLGNILMILRDSRK